MVSSGSLELAAGPTNGDGFRTHGYTALKPLNSFDGTEESCGGTDEPLIAAQSGHPISLRILRRSVFAILLVGLVCVVSFDRLLDMAARAGGPQYTDDLRGGVQLWHNTEGPYDTNSRCPNDGGVCICGDVKGECKSWTFQVGDVIVFEPAYVNSAEQWFEASLSSIFFFSDAMHVVTVVEVTSQTGEGITVLEALKPPVGIVKRENLRYVLHRWPLVGFWIKRPDPARFSLNQAAIAQWSNSILNQPFDKKMLIPFFRRWATKGRFVWENADAKERQRALDLYSSGGPGKWICSQLAEWTLAFAGGLNSVNSWPIGNLQGVPADVLRLKIWEKSNWHIKCTKQGCFIALPGETYTVTPTPRLR